MKVVCSVLVCITEPVIPEAGWPRKTSYIPPSIHGLYQTISVSPSSITELPTVSRYTMKAVVVCFLFCASMIAAFPSPEDKKDDGGWAVKTDQTRNGGTVVQAEVKKVWDVNKDVQAEVHGHWERTYGGPNDGQRDHGAGGSIGGSWGKTHERRSIKVAPDSNLSDFTILPGGVGDSPKDLVVFTKSRQFGTNACADNNGGCAELCLYNGTHPVCACAHGLVAEDGKTCKEYDSFLMYSRVVRIDSVHISDEYNLNAPYPSIQSKELMRNAIGLTYDYSRSTLFYSDIQQGSINAVLFNGSNHRVIVERQGSVEGLAYEMIDNILYWTCNNNATINKVNLSEEVLKPETIIKLEPSDKPRGIAIDSCDRRMYWTNWTPHHPCIQRAFLTGNGQQAIITTDIRLPNALTLDHRAQKLYWGDARLDKIERCEYDGSNRVILAKVTPQHPFDMAVHGDLLFWTDWVQRAVLRANKYTGADVVLLRKDIPRPMGIVAIYNNSNDCFSNPCKIQKGGCEDICQLSAEGNVICSCHENRSLLSDKKGCATRAAPNCTEDEFQCSNPV